MLNVEWPSATPQSTLNIQHSTFTILNTDLFRAARSRAARSKTTKLLDGNLGARLFEDLLDLLGFFLRDVLLDHLRSAFDEILRFFQAERGDFADGFDDVDLLVAGAVERHGELGLHFGRCGSGGSGAGSGSRGGGSGGG